MAHLGMSVLMHRAHSAMLQQKQKYWAFHHKTGGCWEEFSHKIYSYQHIYNLRPYCTVFICYKPHLHPQESCWPWGNKVCPDYHTGIHFFFFLQKRVQWSDPGWMSGTHQSHSITPLQKGRETVTKVCGLFMRDPSPNTITVCKTDSKWGHSLNLLLTKSEQDNE